MTYTIYCNGQSTGELYNNEGDAETAVAGKATEMTLKSRWGEKVRALVWTIVSLA
jgi:hypothetical protein